MPRNPCLVAGWDTVCELEAGHDGMHYQRRGAGSASWSKAASRWDSRLGRWVKPSEPEYEEGLQRIRETYR